MGGGGKGGGQSTQYSGVTIPPEVLARYNKATDRAETASQTPWQNYEGTFVAPVNETQTAGYGTMMGGQSYTQAGWEAPNAALQQGVAGAQPLLGQAGAQYNNALQQGQQGTQNALAQGQQAFNSAAPLTSGALMGAQPYQGAATGLAMAGTQAVNPTGLNIQQFYNPYQQDVVQATMAQLGQQQAQQRMDQRGSMIKEGTFGGDRGGIANANMVNQQNLATGSVLSGLNQGNYNQALQAAQQQQGVGLGAAQANRAALQQGAGQMLGIGQQGFQQGMGAGQQLYGQGMGLANLQGQMGQQAYGQGIGGGQALQGLGTAGYGMMSDAAARQAGFAGQAFGQNMQTAQGQTGFGTLQQQTQQAQDSAVYNQWLQERGYPFQTSQFYTNAVLGTGPLSGTGAYGGSFSPQPFFSDERLKENITSVGTTHDGKDVLAYNMAGDPRTQIGLSAQDVAKDKPEAVGSRGGYLTLDYDKALQGAKEPRQHAAIGGGADPFSGGLGGLAQTANIGAGVGHGFGGLPDIVAMQKRALGSNAPGSIKPPSTAGLAGDPAMKGPGNPPPPPAAAAPGLSPVVAAALASAVPAAAAVNDPGSGDGGAGNSVDSGATTGPGPGPGPGPGNGVGSGTGETYAEGGRAGFARAGDVGDSYPGYMAPQQSAGFGDILKSNQALYQALLGQNVAGTGNQGVAGGLNIPSGPAKASQMMTAKLPQAQAQRATTDQAGDALDKATKFGKGAGELYDEGKDALYGSPAKGKPGEKGYKEATGGLFGKGGERNYEEGWWHKNLGTDSWGKPAAVAEEVSFVPAGDYGSGAQDYALTLPGFEGLARGGRTGFALSGKVDEGDMPFAGNSILPTGSYDEEKVEVPDSLKPPDPTGKKEAGKGDSTKSSIKTGLTAAASLAGMATGMPWLGPVVGLFGSAVARGGRTYAEGGEVNDNVPEPGLAPAAEATGEVHYGIFSRSQGHKMIGRATTMSGARRVRTQRDSAFGGSDHFIKPIPTTRKRWAGGRLGFADAGEVIEPSDNEAYLQALEKQRKLEGLSAATTEPAPELSPLAKAIEEGRSRQEGQGALGAAGRGIQVAQAPSPTPIVAVPPPPIPSADDAAGERATVPQRAPVPPVPGAPPPPPPPAPASPSLGGAGTAPALPTDFNSAVGKVMSFEGGKGRDSNGAAVNMGINQAFHRDIDVNKLTPDQARDIYKNQYWNQIGADNLPDNMRMVVFDAAVNSGVARAQEWLQQSGNDPVKFNQIRRDFLQRLVDSDPKQYGSAAQGWSNRLVELGGQPLTGFKYTGKASGAGGSTDPAGMSVPAGLGPIDSNPNTSYWGTRNGDWWGRNESYLLPLLSGIGGMLSSPSHTLAGSIGSGLVAGAEQYMTRGQRQQGIDIQKQTQNIAQAGKMFEAADRISRDRAGFMQSRPGQSTKGYDDAYAAVTGKAYQLMAGVPGMGMRPADAADWAKAQPKEVQDFHNQVVPEDDPFYLSSIAAGPVDQATRSHYEGLAKAAAERAMKGLSRGRNGSNVMLSPALTQAWLDRERQASQANSTGQVQTPDAAIKRVQDEAASILAQHRVTHPDNLPPAAKTSYDALMARIEELRRTARPPTGGMHAGGRVGRAFGGLLYGAPPTDESAAVPAVANDADLVGDNIQQIQLQGGPGAPPPPSRSIAPDKPPAPGEPAAPPPKQFDRNNPRDLDDHANALRAMGNHSAAADYETRATELRERYRASGLRTKTVNGVEVTDQTPGARETAQENWQQAQNQKTLQMAQEQSINAEALQQELAKYKSTLFDEANKPKTTMGPITTVLAPLAAWGHQLGLSDEIVKNTIGLSSTDIEVATKSKLALAQQMATASMGNKQTEGLFNQLLNSGIAGPQMSAAAASFIIDHIYVPKAQFDAKLYDHLKQGNIYEDDYWSRRQDYYRNNKMYPPVPPAPAKPPEVISPEVPASLSGIRGLEHSPSTGNFRDPATKREYDRTGKPLGGP